MRNLLFILLLIGATGAFAQTDALPREVSDYLAANAQQLGLQPADFAEARLTDSYQDGPQGTRHFYVQQYYRGIPIGGAIAGYHTTADGKPIHFTTRFEPKLNSRLLGNSPQLGAKDAVAAAARYLDLPFSQAIQVLERGTDAQQTGLIAGGEIARQDIPVRLVYQRAATGHILLAWRVEIYTHDAQHYYVARVDATSGKVIDTEDLVLSCSFDHAASAPEDCDHAHTAPLTAALSAEAMASRSAAQTKTMSGGNYYRVFDLPVETPNHGSRSLVVTNGDPLASPFGWHNDGTVAYPFTKGNNVYAYLDNTGANAGEPTVGGLNPLQPLNFDFPLDLSQQPINYKDAAVTNLFYWNNKIHDIMYHFGFTEPAGNFQQSNLNRGGVSFDAVMAEAQDGGGTNNANFLTLPDGAPGRMQMYLWSSSSPADLVHIENSARYPNGGLGLSSLQAAFGADVDENGVTAELVLVQANANSSSTCNSCGCGTGQGVGLPPANDVNGKIVLIDRGDCSFIEKVMGAQLGGAVGVIVANNLPGSGPISMGGDETGNAIVIPAVMIGNSDGIILKDELASGPVTVSLRRDEPLAPMKDGDLDNGIIVHEYGHGISIRLTGGPSSTCLGGDEQAGEGWSDYFALMLTTDGNALADGGFFGRGIGTYVFDEPTTGNGIRPARYSRDMTVNPYTYADLNNAEISVPHGIGFIFCTALHDMTWNLIDAYGYNPDLVNGTIASGNILALQLVMDGLKLQPCSPTFLESRDAILAADQALTGGANACLIWEAFAKRGMGFSAQSGTNSRGDEVAAFDMPPSCTPVVSIQKSADRTVAENGSVIEYTLTVKNGGDVLAKNVKVSDVLAPELTYVPNSGGTYQASQRRVKFPTIQLAPGAERTFTFKAIINTPGETDLAFFDDMEDGISAWSPSFGLNQWRHTAGAGNSGDFAWFAADPDNASDQTLTFAAPVVLPADAELHFTHRFSTEAGFDGGVVEISNDGGLTWYDLGNQMTQGGYTDFIPVANNPLLGGFAYGGNSNGWMKTVVDLSLFSGQSVLIRFRLASDVLTPGDGWYVDDVFIGTDVTEVSNTGEFSATGNISGSSSVSSLVTAPGQAKAATTPQLSQKLDNATATGEDFRALAFPNPTNGRAELTLDGLTPGDLRIETLDVNGRLLRNRELQTAGGSERHSLDLSALSSGLYTLRIVNGDRATIVRLTKQR